MKLIRDSVSLFVDKITIIEPDGYVRDVYGFANENGEVVIPHKYDYICEVLSELAIVVIENDEKSYKVINAQGTMLYEYDDLQWHHDLNRGAVCLDGKWGVVNERFEVICPIKYEDIAWYNENTIFVRLNDKWGAVNSHNELICDFMFDDLVQPPFCCERVNIFKGFRIESNQLIGICINDKWGFMTEDFNVICEPKYDSISKFANGCAAVGIGDRVGFIDENANEIYPVKYTTQSAWKIDKVIPLQDGEKYGWFDSQSKYLCEPKYDEDLEFKINGDNIVVTLNGKKGIMRSNGVEVYPLQCDEIEPWYTFGYPISVAYLVCKDGKYGVLDPKIGDYILEPIYDKVSNDGGLVETLCIGNKYGYVRVKQDNVIKSEFIYDEIKSWDLLVAYRKENKWGAHIIEDDGAIIEVLECKYDDIDSGNGYLVLGINEKYAFAQISLNDRFVRMICDYKYDDICIDVDGLAAVRSGEKWGVIKADGKEICEIKYDDIRHSAQPYDVQLDIEYPRLFGVMLGDKWGFINVQGEEICPFQFDRIERWTSEYEGDEYYAYIGDVCYMLDKNGTFVVCS